MNDSLTIDQTINETTGVTHYHLPNGVKVSIGLDSSVTVTRIGVRVSLDYLNTFGPSENGSPRESIVVLKYATP